MEDKSDAAIVEALRKVPIATKFTSWDMFTGEIKIGLLIE